MRVYPRVFGICKDAIHRKVIRIYVLCQKSSWLKICFVFKAFTSIGVNIDLMFPKQGDTLTVPPENVDFYREKDKV